MNKSEESDFSRGLEGQGQRNIKNLLVTYLHDRELRRVAACYARGRMIDVGCGAKPYREVMGPHVSVHIGIDHQHTLHDPTQIDAFATAYHIPFKDASFDVALCTAVLEHLEEPAEALKECCRVLKPGAKALYSVPFIWHLHEEPRDFYRYSNHGLRYLFEKAGFEILELKALSGFWVTFGQLLVYHLYRLNHGPLRWFRIVDAMGILFQALFYALDGIDKKEQWTWMYFVVARKHEALSGKN